jgi:hypothetical protein
MFIKQEKPKKKKKDPKPQALSGRRSNSALQFGKTPDNKARKLLRHCRNHPDDKENGARYGKTLDYTPRGLKRSKYAARVGKLLPGYQQDAREEISRMKQHNANQQAIQGPLLSEIGFRVTLQNLRHQFSKDIRHAKR